MSKKYSKLIELLNLCLRKNIPFVSYSLPDEATLFTWIQLSGQFNYVEHIHEVIDKPGFVYAPFHRRTNFPIAFFEPEKIIKDEEDIDSLISEISSKDQMFPDYELEVPESTDKQSYLNQAEKYISTFDRSFPKAVLSRVQLIQRQESFNVAQFFIKLHTNYPNAFCHLINLPGAGIWAGASPETLLRIKGDKAHTVSLAGTQPENHVNWTSKEVIEQKIVTDHIKDVLADFGIENYNCEETGDLQAGKAVHRATMFSFDKFKIEGRLADFIKKIHPTPAVCGHPKENALNLILNTEKHNREYYSGYCGPLHYQNKTDLFVNLRCVKILPEYMALYVGGGLTVDSSPTNEWEETELKATTILNYI